MTALVIYASPSLGLFVGGSPMKSLHPSVETTVSLTPYLERVLAQLLLTDIT